MNWIDFNILCVGAKKVALYENEVFLVEAMNNNPNKTCKCYVRNWDVVNHIQGIWYELWTINDENDFIINSTWQLDHGNKSYGYQLFIEKENENVFSKILNYYIKKSPIKKIIVLFRHQGYETGIIKNTMPVSEFIDKLIRKDIYGNVAYILSA